MRHRKRNVKLGRSPEHRRALLASLVGHLIEQHRIRTTLVKARLARRLADKMVTLGKAGSLAARRQAVATLRDRARVAKLFATIAPGMAERKGGYTRIVKVGRRSSDGSEMALLEWVGIAPVERRRPAAKGEAAKKPDKAKAAAAGT